MAQEKHVTLKPNGTRQILEYDDDDDDEVYWEIP
jgi:hypothetical protein